MASKTRILAIPKRTPLSPPTPTSLSLLRRTTPLISKPQILILSLLRPKSNLLAATASSSPPPPPIPTQNPTHHSALTGSTRTITTIFSIALSISKLLAFNLVGGLFNTPPTATGPLFFAAIGQGVGPKSAGEPIAVIAAGLARWLEIYSCVLLIRVLLSWFPNMPWEKQPLSAVRDLCDPYLSLFRGIIPPLFNSLDVSPILAFLLLGMLGQFARAPREQNGHANDNHFVEDLEGRNARVFNEDSIDPQQAFYMAVREAAEFIEGLEGNLAGAVARNSSGRFVAARSIHLGGAESALAWRAALEFALTLELDAIIVEGDSAGPDSG
ncbi:hypothetical protein RHSIM_Rhsim01G0073700 [Rhododendron simsii]|uniref:Uncharacterized protein n=1 Tax=Rhododendron simsii TaxID=118357 RepID=A0A834HL45_RHOSS|nr:hypothetical protein RHSIM_Rhsim01G0073700 [Rhododendron simsii]